MKRIVEKYLSLFTDENPLEIFSEDDLNFIYDCISLQEERRTNVRDQWGNWDFQYTEKNFSEPYCDLFVLERLQQKGFRKKNIWPHGKPFALCVTHDVDLFTDISPKSVIRHYMKKPAPGLRNKIEKPFVASKNIALSCIRSLMSKRDILWNYEIWSDIESKYNFKSTFFAFVRPRDNKEIHEFDCLYRFSDPIVFRGKKSTVAGFFISIHNSGWEIGLHGSYLSYDSEKILLKQKRSLQEVIQDDVISVRQHYLRYDISKTPLVHNSVGLKIDSTVGFNRNIGFRAGTCMPFFCEDNSGHILDVLEFPQIIMDISLFSSSALELDADKAIMRSIKLMDHVEKVGGCLIINFHPNYLYEKKYMVVFETILQEAKKRNAFNATLKETKAVVEKTGYKVGSGKSNEVH